MTLELDKIRILLKELSKRESSNTVFNQYINDNARNNLELYFRYLLSNKHDILMVGEAPGYKGCGITGIPFTSGNVIIYSQHAMFNDIRSQIKLDCIVSEATASIFWDFLTKAITLPVLWNAFPFHPHEYGMSNSNRKPKEIELQEGKKYLSMVYDLFHPKKICAIGRTSETVLKELFPKTSIKYIRHPARGGKQEFINAMQSVM